MWVFVFWNSPHLSPRPTYGVLDKKELQMGSDLEWSIDFFYEYVFLETILIAMSKCKMIVNSCLLKPSFLVYVRNDNEPQMGSEPHQWEQERIECPFDFSTNSFLIHVWFPCHDVKCFVSSYSLEISSICPLRAILHFFTSTFFKSILDLKVKKWFTLHHYSAHYKSGCMT